MQLAIDSGDYITARLGRYLAVPKWRYLVNHGDELLLITSWRYLIANISRTKQDNIVEQKTALQTAISPAHAHLILELWSTNGEK